jgi:hypothetical protein
VTDLHFLTPILGQIIAQRRQRGTWGSRASRSTCLSGDALTALHSAAITKGPSMSWAGAVQSGKGQNVATLDGSAGSLCKTGFEPGHTEVSAPAT